VGLPCEIRDPSRFEVALRRAKTPQALREICLATLLAEQAYSTEKPPADGRQLNLFHDENYESASGEARSAHVGWIAILLLRRDLIVYMAGTLPQRSRSRAH